MSGHGHTASDVRRMETALTGRELYVQFAKTDPRAQAPRNAYGNDAGWDLFVLERTVMFPGDPIDIRSGVAVAIPDGYYGRIVGRSSAIRKRRVQVQEGIIDAGFRGELFACCVYLGRHRGDPTSSFDATSVEPGESLAQLIIQPVPLVQWEQVDQLPESARGKKGFGSSG